MCQLHSSKDIDDQNHNLDLDLPIKKRQCTDVLCCVLFFICLTLLGALAVFSFAMGDYRRIIFPKDSQGKICGLDYPNQGRLFFFDMASCLDISDVVIALGCPTTKVCVSSCPTYRLTQPYNDDQNFRELVICEGGVSGNAEAYAHKPINDLCNSGKCACEITPTESILGRCFPKNLFPVLQNRTERVLADPKAEKPPPSLTALVFGARTLVTEMLEDLIRTWKVIIVCLFLAAFASFLWIVLLRLCTCVMVYFTLLVFTALFALATGFCFWRYAVTKKLASQPPPFYLTLDITILFRYSTTWLILGIVSVLILLLVLTIMIFLRKKIYFASNVIGEASKAIGHMPFTLFWPIFPFAFILGTIALWLFVDLNLRSIATAEGVYLNHTTLEPKSEFSRKTLDWVFDDANKCDPLATYTEGQFCFYVKHVVTNYTPWLQIYNFAVCLWLINYIIAVDQLTLAGTFAKFYFSQRQLRRRGGSSSCYFCGVCLVFGTCASAIIFHTGSLAFGSLLITLLALLRAILLKIERRLKMADNEIAKFFIRCLCCCFWCLDKFLRFLNKNAYIMMAIYGHGFCRSAKDVFSLIVRNVIRVFVVEKITDFVLFLGKLAVSAAVSFFAYAYLSGVISDRLDIVPDPTIHLNYIIVPILVIALGSFFVAKAFFTVYEMGIDTIFICVCEDLERNDGSEGKPYLMSKSLMKTLKKPEMEDETS